MLAAGLLLLALGAVACGESSDDVRGATAAPSPRASSTATPVPVANPDDPDQLYEGYGMVLDTPTEEPQLCLGSVEESLPPQCGGVPIEGWDWDVVEGEEAAGRTTWGDFRVVGTYDGETFTVHEAEPPKEVTDSESELFGTPCPEPEGGWPVPDPKRASQEDASKTQVAIQEDPDFAAMWLDYYDRPPGPPTETTEGSIILNVAFTGDLERHEKQVRELWGGALCLSLHERTQRELSKVQREFPVEEFGLQTLWSNLDVVRGVVQIGAVWIDAETLQRIEERYGPGVVEIIPALRPVD